MRSAARIVENMHSHIYDIIEPGLAKNELAAEIFHAGIKGKDEHWGDYPAIMPLLPTGMDATAAHLTWDDSKLKGWRYYLFRNCRLSQALSLSAIPHYFARERHRKNISMPKKRYSMQCTPVSKMRNLASAAKTLQSRFSIHSKPMDSKKTIAPVTR